MYTPSIQSYHFWVVKVVAYFLDRVFANSYSSISHRASISSLKRALFLKKYSKVSCKHASLVSLLVYISSSRSSSIPAPDQSISNFFERTSSLEKIFQGLLQTCLIGFVVGVYLILKILINSNSSGSRFHRFHIHNRLGSLHGSMQVLWDCGVREFHGHGFHGNNIIHIIIHPNCKLGTMESQAGTNIGHFWD